MKTIEHRIKELLLARRSAIFVGELRAVLDLEETDLERALGALGDRILIVSRPLPAAHPGWDHRIVVSTRSGREQAMQDAATCWSVFVREMHRSHRCG